MISERLDVEPRREEEAGVSAANLKEAKTCHARGSSESVHGTAKAEHKAEGRCTGALAVEAEVPPTTVIHKAHNVVPSIVLTAPDDGDDELELFPSRTNSPVSTASAASNTSCGGSLGHSRVSLHSHSPPATSPSRLSVSPDSPSKLAVSSTSILQPLSSRPPSSIGSILEEPLLEEEMAEQCLYDYRSGDGSADCMTQFTPQKPGEKGEELQSLVTVPKECEGENVNLLKKKEPASWKRVHGERPRAMSFPEVQSESSHRASLLWDRLRLLTKDKDREQQEHTPDSVVEQQQKDSSSSMGVQRVSDVIMRAKKWRKKALATKGTEEDAEMNTEEERPELHARRRAMIEIPQAIHVEMLTEAQCILQRTLKMYQTALGLGHPLAGKAAVKLKELESQLED